MPETCRDFDLKKWECIKLVVFIMHHNAAYRKVLSYSVQFTPIVLILSVQYTKCHLTVSYYRNVWIFINKCQYFTHLYVYSFKSNMCSDDILLSCVLFHHRHFEWNSQDRLRELNVAIYNMELISAENNLQGREIWQFSFMLTNVIMLKEQTILKKNSRILCWMS
jgi:hypothetical protein